MPCVAVLRILARFKDARRPDATYRLSRRRSSLSGPKASGRSIGSDRGMVRQILEVTLFSSGSFVVWHSRRFDTAKDSTEMACERDHYQREQSHCEISDTRRKAFRAEARAHPGENEDEQSGSKRADHMQP